MNGEETQSPEGIAMVEQAYAMSYEIEERYPTIDIAASGNTISTYQNMKVAQNDFDVDLKEEGTFLSAKVQYELGTEANGITAMENYLNNYPQGKFTDEISELLSEAYLSSNDYKRAINYIEALSRRNSKIDLAYQKATYYLGTEYFNKRDYRRAVDMFQKSLAKPFDRDFVRMANFWIGEAFRRRLDE